MSRPAEKIVGMGLLRLADPMPVAYPLITARPEGSLLVIEVRRGAI